MYILSLLDGGLGLDSRAFGGSSGELRAVDPFFLYHLFELHATHFVVEFSFRGGICLF